MIEIIPAVLAKDFKDLESQIEQVRGLSNIIQIDVVDGSYARTRTWPYTDRATFEKIVEQEHGLPHWDELDFEFDLMIDDPLGELMRFVQAGASSVIIHASSPSAPAALQKLVDLREDSGAFVVRAGLALRAHDGPERLEQFEAQYDFVQIMGIEHEGRQGEAFDPDNRARYLVERLHHLYPALPLQVDGAAASRARELVAAGATRLVVGSAILRADDPRAAYKEIYTRANAQ